MTITEFFDKFPGAPYMIDESSQRIPNPALSKTFVSEAGHISLHDDSLLDSLTTDSTYVYPFPVLIPVLDYEGPITIKTPGLTVIHDRNFRSLDNGPAVNVWNGAMLIMYNCTIVSKGDCINATGNADLTIHHCNFYGDTPLNNEQYGRAVNAFKPAHFEFYNNNVEHTGGLLIDHNDVSSLSVKIYNNVSSLSVKIYNNIIRNTDKRRVDGSVGDHRASILFNTVKSMAGYITRNKFVNEMNLSHVEDIINLYNSGGIEGSPFIIYDNFIFGAYPFPLTADYYTGSGITVDGDPGTNQLTNMSQWINIHDNQVVSTCNACMNIAAGHDIHSFNNTYLSSGMFPDGTVSQRFWGGCCIWDASNVGANFKNNDQKNNVIGYARPGVNVPYPNRQDWVTVGGNPLSVKAGDNTSLPNAPITLAMELAEYAKFDQKMKDQRQVIGNSTITPPIDVASFACEVGEEMSFTISAANETGEDTSYKSDSILVASDSLIEFVLHDGNILDIEAMTAGISKVSVSLRTNADKVLTKNFNIVITGKLPEATQIIITQIKK